MSSEPAYLGGSEPRTLEDRVTLSSPAVGVLGVILLVAAVAGWFIGLFDTSGAVPSFRRQVCSLPAHYRELIRHGYYAPRSGQISLLPKRPAYFATGAGGWSHSGPWRYLQHVPIVFYGPGAIARSRSVARPVSMADVAPTLARLMHFRMQTADGRVLPSVVRHPGRAPKLIVTVVWDGGGWNVLDQWPDDWPNLKHIMRRGVTFTNAIDGSSPSVTPSVHTTLGTGVFPWRHGISGIPVRDESGEITDAFEKGESSRFVRVPTLAERWDEKNDNKALVGMVGYEPWHLGMIGQGAERPGGDRDDAAWLDIETNEWISNPKHYRLPTALGDTGGLQRDLRMTDAADGRVDGSWRDKRIIDEPDHWEEIPGFIDYHERGLEHMIQREGYGTDSVTDLLFTNFKQIDRNGHYYNMASPEVRDSLDDSDRALGRLIHFLNHSVGRRKWALVMTADHGQQPDDSAVDGYAIDPNEMERDIDAEFGPITQAVWPTEAFLDLAAMKERGVDVADVARFIGDYRLRDNSKRPDQLVSGSGMFDPGDRIIRMAVPSRMLASLMCAPPGARRSPSG